MKIVDLSRELYHRTPSYPGHPPVMHGVWKNHEEAFADSKNVWGLSSMFISMPDHGGTHIDAPRHFGPKGIPIDQYPLENCIVPGICLDLDITHIESLCNLEALLGKGQFTFIGLPMKWREGTASPIRAVAVFDM